MNGRDPIDDPDLLADMTAEVATLAIPMELVLRPLSAFMLAGLVQLALRHPDVGPEVRATGERFVAGVREFFADCPATLEVLRRGDDPQYDVSRGDAH